MKKKKMGDWGEEQSRAFEKLKGEKKIQLGQFIFVSEAFC